MSREDIISSLLEDRICFATVSGIFSTKPNIIEWTDKFLPEVEVITTKSFQIVATPGYREAVICEPKVGCYGNAVGLRNPGMDTAFDEIVALRKRRKLRALLNVSIAADSLENFVTLVKKFENVADIIELNFSCPHAAAGFGSSIGSSAAVVSQYVSAMRAASQAVLFPKLTPNVANIGEIAQAAMEAGADGIVAINTVGPECYLEPHTGKPIFTYSPGNKGGKSGDWILDAAIEKIAEVREAVGQAVPIIGMGGIRSGEDVRRMKDAGANVIGLGSVLARVHQRDKAAYVRELKQDAETGTAAALRHVSNERLAEYKPYTIKKITAPRDDLKVFELEGELEYQASQYAFLWIPGVGEKPFSIALEKPLTFVVRKRDYEPEHNKGLLTHALFQLEEGQELMLRGVYGADAPDTEKGRAVVLAGGTGIAVVPMLVEKLKKQGKTVRAYYGIRSADQVLLKEEIEACAEYLPIADDGVLGRVLEVMNTKEAQENVADTCFYNIGPVHMMQRAMEIQENLGAEAESVFSSLETHALCGIGMCGACECGAILTCQEGTFISLAHLKAHGIDIVKLEEE